MCKMIGRLLALILLLFPLAIASLGVKLFRDALFAIVDAPFSSVWLELLVGVICFVFGIGFIGGWIVSRDRKRHYHYRNRSQKSKSN